MWQNLRAWRRYRGLTLVEVGQIMDTAHSTILRWERGTQSVPTHQVIRLAAAYGCTPAELEYTPADRERGQIVHTAIELAQSLSPEAARAWLAAGMAMTPSKNNPRDAHNSID